MTILIGEDNRNLADALARILKQRLGGPVICEIAGTLAEVLRLSVELSPDITILDPGLPGSTREEVILSVPYMTPPVIVVTEYEDDSDHSFEQFCYENRVQRYFTKKDLRETILQKAGAELCSAITRAYWRNVLPSRRVNAIHEAAELAADGR